MIEVSEYQKSFFDLLVALHEEHACSYLDSLTPEVLPEIGYVAYNSGTIICMGFLRRIEGGYAQIDTLISNKALPSEIRHEGITVLVDQLIKKAKEIGIKGIVSYTSDDGILSRALSIGFKDTKQSVIALNLSE